MIDLLSLERGKAYGFQEYIFNLLNYFYQHRGDIQFESIIIWCRKTEVYAFEQFSDKFEIEG